MAELTLDLRDLPKADAYAQLETHVDVVLEGIDDDIAEMATLSALVYHGFGILWAGFYRLVTPDLLRVGPYQGTLGCLEIAVGRGVCGTAARDRTTIIVPDVSSFPGHITCDANARSEIVVPVLDRDGRLTAVFDLDATTPDRFDREDAVGLERLVARFARPR